MLSPFRCARRARRPMVYMQDSFAGGSGVKTGDTTQTLRAVERSVLRGKPGAPQQAADEADERREPRGERDVKEYRRQEGEKIEMHRALHLVRARRVHAEREYRAPVQRVVL